MYRADRLVAGLFVVVGLRRDRCVRVDVDALERNEVGLSGLYVSTRVAGARRLFRPGGAWPYVLEPAWSANGEWIAFTYYRTDRNSDVLLVPVDDGPALRVTSGRAVDRGPAWLPPASPLTASGVPFQDRRAVPRTLRVPAALTALALGGRIASAIAILRAPRHARRHPAFGFTG